MPPDVEIADETSLTAIDRWERWVWNLTVLLACGMAFTLRSAEPDLWGHVQYGREVLMHGLPFTTTYSYTAEGYRWINHENLSEIAFAYAADTYGPWALLLGKCVMGTVIVGWIYLRAQHRKVRTIIATATALLVAVNLTCSWHVRPHLFSYFFFALLIGILSRAFRGWEDHWHLPRGYRSARADRTRTIHEGTHVGRVAWLIPLLIGLWANTHGGFAAGLVVFVAYVALRSIEAACSLNSKRIPLIRHLLLIASIAALATFVNPYGVRLHLWMWNALGAPRPEITEWQPLSWHDESFIPFLLLATTTVVGLAASRRPIDFTHLAILTLVAWQAVTHNRHVPFFAIAVGFWMPQHWESVAWRISGAAQQAVRSGNYVDWFPTISLGATSALLALALAQRVCELPVDTRTYPVDAVDFISKHKLHGRMIVTFNWAQYVLAAVGTPVESNHGISVQFDGRFRTCYPQEIIDEHFDFVLGTAPHVPRYRLAHSPTNDDARILRRGNPNLVLISRRQSHSTTIMQQQRDDWALLYEDSLCQLWGRRNIYDDQDGCDFLPHEQRLVTPNRQPSVDYIAWPAFPPTSEPHTRFANRQPGLATPYSEQPQL